MISDERDALSMRRLHVKDIMKEYGQLRVCAKTATVPSVKAESPFRLPSTCIIAGLYFTLIMFMNHLCGPAQKYGILNDTSAVTVSKN